MINFRSMTKHLLLKQKSRVIEKRLYTEKYQTNDLFCWPKLDLKLLEIKVGSSELVEILSTVIPFLYPFFPVWPRFFIPFLSIHHWNAYKLRSSIRINAAANPACQPALLPAALAFRAGRGSLRPNWQTGPDFGAQRSHPSSEEKG